MKQGWEEKRLGDVSAVSAGNSAPQKKELFKNGIYPFIRTSDVGKIRKGFISASVDYLNDEGINGLKLYKSGTILFPKSGASTFLNHRVMMKIDGYVSSHLATIKANNSITDDRYLLYFLITIDARSLMQDIAYPSLKASDIRLIEIPIPPLPEQKRIVAILDKAFASIAKAKDNAEQNLNNAKELFESYLQGVFENKGEGWEIKKLGDVCELIKRGVSPKYLEKNGVIVINQKCIRDHRISFEQSRFHDSVLKKVSPEKMVKLGDVLINSTGTGTLGRVAQVREDLKNVTVDSHVTIVRPIPNLFFIDFFGWALIYIEDEIAKRGKGCGGQTELARTTLTNNFSISFPKSFKAQQAIVKKLDSLSSKTKKLETIYQQKIEDLEELKKSVLQKAFNGELT